MKKKKVINGFTLIELVVAAGIMSVLSVAGIRLIWDTVMSRSRQYQIESSSENVRNLIAMISADIREAKSVSIPDSSTIEITGTVCKTYKLISQKLEMAKDISASCSPPSTGFNPVSVEDMEITGLDLSPVGPLPVSVNIAIEGNMKDSLGTHPFEYSTSVVPRVSM